MDLEAQLHDLRDLRLREETKALLDAQEEEQAFEELHMRCQAIGLHPCKEMIKPRARKETNPNVAKDAS